MMHDVYRRGTTKGDEQLQAKKEKNKVRSKVQASGERHVVVRTREISREAASLLFQTELTPTSTHWRGPLALAHHPCPDVQGSGLSPL
jgi:hypothetical protein